MSVKTALLLLSFCCISFAQKSNQQKITIFLDVNDKALKEYYIDKDTTTAFFNIHIIEYQTKKSRDKAMNEHYKNLLEENSAGLPRFSIGFYVFDIKPEKLKSLECIDYITVKQFRENNYKTTSPTYIIHRLKDGTYLKWKTFTMN